MINTLISHQTLHSQIIPDLELWIINITFLDKLDYTEQSAFFYYFSFLFCNHVSIQSHCYLNIQVNAIISVLSMSSNVLLCAEPFAFGK